MHLDLIRDFAGPGIVFLLLAFWLVRKAWRAARTERQLEAERELPPEPDHVRPHLVHPVGGPLASADTAHARAEHLALIAPEAQGQVLWVRSLGEHVAWLESLPAGEHALRVARVGDGTITERWTFS